MKAIRFCYECKSQCSLAYFRMVEKKKIYYCKSCAFRYVKERKENYKNYVKQEN